MANELSIIKKMETFYKQFYCYRKKFPKQDRHLLGAKCEQCIMNILELLWTCEFLSKTQKSIKLKLVDKKIDLLKPWIRLLNELEIIDQRKYLILEKQLQTIGKELGGWLKSL